MKCSDPKPGSQYGPISNGAGEREDTAPGGRRVLTRHVEFRNHAKGAGSRSTRVGRLHVGAEALDGADTSRAMSQENVEILREAWRAYQERGIDAALEYCADDCVCEDFPELPDRATYRGGMDGASAIDSFAALGGTSCSSRQSS